MNEVFVDTNVLVYRRDRSEPEKQARAEEWMAYLWESRKGRVSLQVLDEFYVTVTRRLRPGLDRSEAREEVRNLFAWRPVPIDRPLVESAWRLQDRYDLPFWDALIASAALLADCRYLLSEDFRDGQAIDGVRVISPFTRRPDDLE